MALIRGDRVSASYASKGAKESKAKKTSSPEEVLAKLNAMFSKKENP